MSRRTAGRTAGEKAPSLQEQLDRLELMVDETVELVRRLTADNRKLSQRLAESERRRQAAVRRLDTLLERIEEADRVAAGQEA